MPRDLHVYKQLPEWTAATLPDVFQRMHNTRAGTWARLEVRAGALRFITMTADGEELGAEIVDRSSGPLLVAPGVWHRVEPIDDTLRCQLSFLRESEPED